MTTNPMLVSRCGGVLKTAAMAAFLICGTALPSSAGLFGDIICITGICNTGGGSTQPPATETGVIQVVFMVGDGFFPDKVHAKPGDRIKFYNLSTSSVKVKADDNSWSSGYLGKNESYSFILQDNTTLGFTKAGWFTSMSGTILREDPPAAVNFGDLVDYKGNVVGKNGVVVRQAEGLGYTLAGLGGTMRDVGNGLALGLNTSLGLANNN